MPTASGKEGIEGRRAVASLVELLLWRAARQPDRRVFTFLEDGEVESGHLTFSELDRRARALAGWLQTFASPGDRAVLLYPAGLDFVTAFFGCLYAGVVAVPSPLPSLGRLKRTVPRLERIIEDSRPVAILTTGEERELLFAQVPRLKEVRWFDTCRHLAEPPERWRAPAVGRSNLALLQYTSGSTAVPKGVMVTHGGLLENARYLEESWGLDPDSVDVTWVPHYHDDGLVHGHVLPLYAGYHNYLMPPMALVQRPLRWLEAISDCRATHSGGPNFAYEVCLHRLTPRQLEGLDLSSWRLAYNAAEPVRADTLERFYRLAAPAGFRREAFCPSFGLAEATLLVSAKRGWQRPRVETVDAGVLEREHRIRRTPSEAPDGRALVSSGPAAGETRIEIVDPRTCRPVGPGEVGEVGEVWVASGSVAAGYWGRPEETERIFGARLAGSGEGPFLRTGDLGFLEGGELFITGRHKDLIIIRGENRYPQDIEYTVEASHPALRGGCSAAFSVEESGEERLAIAVEVEPPAGAADLSWAGPVFDAIRSAVSEEHDLQVQVIALLEPRSIHKTSSGKIQRQACRAAFLEGSLEVLASWRQSLPGSGEHAPELPSSRRTRREIEAWLVARLARELGVEAGQVGVRQPFARLGLGSAVSVALTAELGDWLGRTLPPTLLWDHPTIDALSSHLAAEPTSADLRAAGVRGGEAEPIAIIGLSCRFPGARSAEELWRLLRDGVDAITEIPPDRWDVERFYAPIPGTPGKMYTRHGAFLEEVDRFDPEPFGITPLEASAMDPQQRLLLEVAWEALEDAGVVRDRRRNTDCGVFVGISTDDYADLTLRSPDPARVDAYSITGTTSSIAAGRIAYSLGLEGPAIAIDTACSSSLAAVHLAAGSLRSRECRTALAGGVNLILTPWSSVGLSAMRALSPRGCSRAFDAVADGYVRGEGCGLVVLKRLSEALADGDRVLAVIRGSAINQDGRSNGLTAPSGAAQEALLRQALARSGLDPADVDYVEAHGTGTPLGDPIELGALGAVFREGRPRSKRLLVGSIKTNIGHLEPAAGIAGLIKVVLALQHEEIPPHLHFQNPSPYIPWDALPVEVAAARTPWPAGARRRVAGVSSFGFSGTNAHVVLEEPPPAPPPAPDERAPSALLLPLSAPTPDALEVLARRFRDYLAADGTALAGDICYTAGARRTHHEHRLAVIGSSAGELAERLDAFLRGAADPSVRSGRSSAGGPGALAFIFSGQSSQWEGMALDLFEEEPTFRTALERVDAELRRYAPWSLLEELRRPVGGSRIDETELAQPAIFAVQLALVELWRAWGITPGAVAGHSIGEVTAATVAGALSFEQAARWVFHRGRVMQRVAGLGRTAAVELPAAEARRALLGYEDRLAVAAINSPTSTVIAGESVALDEVLRALAERGVSSRLLPMGYAAHSPQIEPLLGELGEALTGLQPRPATLPLFSTVTGRAISGGELAPAHWLRNARDTVRFSETVEEMAKAGFSVFLEVGPHPVLGGALAECLARVGGSRQVLPSLRRGIHGRSVMIGSLGALYASGFSVSFNQLYPRRWRHVPLPPYPWQRRRYWVAPLVDRQAPAGRGEADAPVHPLLGRRLRSALPEVQFEARISADTPLVNEHRLHGTVVMPAVAYVEMALAAAHGALGAASLEELTFHEALVLPEGESHLVQTLLGQPRSGQASLRIAGQRLGETEGEWTTYVTGSIRLGGGATAGAGPSLEEVAARCSEARSFKGIENLRRRDGEALGRVRLPAALGSELEARSLHAALLEPAIRVLGAAIPGGAGAGDDFVPVSIAGVQLHRRLGTELWSHATLHPAAGTAVCAGDVRLLDSAGQLLATVSGLQVKRAPREALMRARSARPGDWLYRLEWRRKSLAREQVAEQRSSQPGTWLILADPDRIGDALARLLEARGLRSVMVSPGGTFRRDGDRLQIDTARAEDWERLLAEVVAADRPHLEGVVHLWSLGSAPAEELDVPALGEAHVLGVEAALHLVRTLVKRGGKLPELLLVTRGAVQGLGTERKPLEVAQAPLWGFGRVLAFEHPELSPRMVDVDPGSSSDRVAEQLLQEMLSPDGERQIVRRGPLRFAARLARMQSASTEATPRFREDGSYLVTGGLGGIGLAVARWMVECGARHLVLVGRGAPSPAARFVVEELERAGARVRVAQADVSDAEQLDGLLAVVDRTSPVLRGVFHAAGVLDDGVLHQQTAERFRRVMAPKVEGAWNLHLRTKGLPLDCFVLFSSVASLLGSPGQGNYAAANAFLDALAHHRRSLGLPALSVNWGRWAGLGMAAHLAPDRRPGFEAMGDISPEQGLEVLEQLLARGEPQVAVLPVRWPAFLRQMPGHVAALASELIGQEEPGAVAARPRSDKRHNVREELTALPEVARRPVLERYLAERISSLLGLDTARVSAVQHLPDLGFDSLAGVEIRNVLQAELGEVLPVTALWTYPTISALATRVAQQMGMALAAVPEESQPGPSPAGGREPAP